MVPVTASPYDAPLSALRDHVGNLEVALAIWQARPRGAGVQGG